MTSAVIQRWLVTAVTAVLVLDATVVALVGTAVDGYGVTREFLFAGIWLLVGVVAIRVGRPGFAHLVLLFSVVLAATLVPGLGLLEGTVFTNAIVTVGAVLLPLQTPLGGHVLLAFPQGDVPERGARWLLRAGYGLAAIEALVVLARQRTYQPGKWCDGCARNLLAGAGPWPAPITLVLTAAWLPLAGWMAVLIVARYRRATRRQRRILRVPYAAIAVFIAAFAVFALIAAGRGGGVYGSLPAAVTLQFLALAGVPACFLVGLVLDRTAQARVAELVRVLATDGADVGSALASALGDPDLLVAFPVDGKMVDLDGRVISPPPGSVITPVGTADPPLAVLIHDRTLLQETALLTSAASAAWLALENARLRAIVLAQLRDVRESRARLVAASDDARRRVERDLHDGAQQRLLAAGLALQMLRERVELTGVDNELLAEAANEVKDAMRELRELAVGIHPAVLTDQGLFAALAELAGRCPIAMTLQGQDPGPLPAAVQSAVYFAVSEAVTNAVKHSRVAECTVRLAVSGSSRQCLVVDVIDRGVGGANQDGRGLRGWRIGWPSSTAR